MTQALQIWGAGVQPGHELAIDYPTDGSNAPIGFATAAANTDAVVTLPNTLLLTTGQRWCLGWIIYSYSATPTGGRLIVKDTTNTETLLDVDITVAGQDSERFAPAIRCKPNATITVTLKAGGSLVVGKVNVMGWFLE